MKLSRVSFSGLTAVALSLVAFAAPAIAQTTFSNTTSIALPGTGSGANTGAPASVYPSNITVSGLTGAITGVTVTLNNLSHTFPDDLDFLLVGPSGFQTLLLSDAFGATTFSNVSLVFSDSGPAAIDSTLTAAQAASFFPGSTFTPPGPGAATLTGGSATFAPTNFGTGDLFPAPAPAGPYAANALSGFNGLAANGLYSLYISDDLGGDIGTLAGGWSITISTNATAAVPEPGSMALLGVGLLPLAGIAVRRSRRRSA